MIIAISGKINSGKDTIGKIIQLISLNSSNREIKEFIENNLTPLESSWKIKKFADKLKLIASILTGISIEKFEDRDFKNTLLGSEWGVIKKNPLNSIPVFEDVDFNHLMSVREFLQKLGTDAMRDNLHENVWVNALFNDYKHQSTGKYYNNQKGKILELPNWVITDLRFPNEAKAVKERNGLLIRVNRDKFQNTNEGILQAEQYLTNINYKIKKLPSKGYPIIKLANEVWLENNNHYSETALNNYKDWDYVINNNGSLEKLVKKVRDILIKEKIII